MTLQVGRYLVKQFHKIKDGKKKKEKGKYIEQIRYLLDYNSLLNEQVNIPGVKELDSLEVLEKLMTIRACNTIDQVSTHLNDHVKAGMKAKTAWDTRSTI